jgi:hypothetical protein
MQAHLDTRSEGLGPEMRRSHLGLDRPKRMFNGLATHRIISRAMRHIYSIAVLNQEERDNVRLASILTSLARYSRNDNSALTNRVPQRQIAAIGTLPATLEKLTLGLLEDCLIQEGRAWTQSCSGRPLLEHVDFWCSETHYDG